MWQSYIKHFKNYLRLERSFSDNSVQAYVRDVEKLAEFFELAKINASPSQVNEEHLFEFLKYVSELGLAAHSQARMLSGIRAFYKYLLLEVAVAAGDQVEFCLACAARIAPHGGKVTR